MAAELAALTDDVLAEILLRVPSPRDLARASTSCAAFRRIVSSRSFLRRFRLLHAPPPLGVFCCYPAGSQFHASVPLHPSAPLARAVARSADFSFAFLPPPAADWLVRDSRDGRFLLDRARRGDDGSTAFTEIAVCDPVFRRYRLLPPIPHHLAASVESTPYFQRGVGDGDLQSRSSEIFLASSRGDDDGSTSEEVPALTVIWIACCRGKLVAFFYSSESQQWRALSPPEHYALSTRRVMGVRLGQRNHAHGCFYWMVALTHRWLMLDTRKMDFSIVDISPVLSGRAMMFSNQITTLESSDGSTTVVVSDVFRPDKRCVLYFYAFMYFSDRWQLLNRVTLPEEWGYRFRGIIGASEGYLFIKLDHPKESLNDQSEQHVEYFSLDVKTMQLGSFCQTTLLAVSEAYLYCGFPASLSLPSI